MRLRGYVTALAILADLTDNVSMAKKRARKRPDPAAFGFAMMEKVVELSGDQPDEPPIPAGKNPHAVALGRRGGLKGGPARAKKLGKLKLREAARKAAQARWKKQPKSIK